MPKTVTNKNKNNIHININTKTDKKRKGKKRATKGKDVSGTLYTSSSFQSPTVVSGGGILNRTPNDHPTNALVELERLKQENEKVKEFYRKRHLEHFNRNNPDYNLVNEESPNPKTELKVQNNSNSVERVHLQSHDSAIYDKGEFGNNENDGVTGDNISLMTAEPHEVRVIGKKVRSDYGMPRGSYKEKHQEIGAEKLIADNLGGAQTHQKKRSYRKKLHEERESGEKY